MLLKLFRDLLILTDIRNILALISTRFQFIGNRLGYGDPLIELLQQVQTPQSMEVEQG